MIGLRLPVPAALALIATALLIGTAAADPTPPSHTRNGQTTVTREAVGCHAPFGLVRAGGLWDTAMLRDIAAGCDDTAKRRLYYNRAYHTELLSDLRLLAQLEKGYAGSDRTRLEQGRIYVALVESFAARAWPRQPGIIAELNRAYEQSIRMVELTIGGYDRLAARPAAGR